MADQPSKKEPFGLTLCIAIAAVLCIAIFRSIGVGGVIGGALGVLVGGFIGLALYKLLSRNKL